MGRKTDDLRERLASEGIVYTCGYCGPNGARFDEDRVTCAWMEPGNALRTTTYEEDSDGHLWCADELTVEQAVAAAKAL